MQSYPKLLLIALTFVLAFLLLRLGYLDWLDELPMSGGMISLIVAGFFLSISFTAAFATVALIELSPHVDPWIAAPLAGFGALCADFLLFSLLRFTVQDELERLKESRIGQWVRSVFHHESLSEKFREYFLLSVAGLVIASPLPDEIGVSLLSASHDVQPRKFAIFCFVVNTIGVLGILLMTRALS